MAGFKDLKIILIGLNGPKKDDIPKTPREIAENIKECYVAAKEDAGIAIHFHGRDSKGKHTLNPDIIKKIMKETRVVFATKKLPVFMQMTTEGVNEYSPEVIISVLNDVSEWDVKDQPHGFSLNLSEAIVPLGVKNKSLFLNKFLKNEKYKQKLHKTLEKATKHMGVQYIAYSPEGINFIEKLITEGILPDNNNGIYNVLIASGKTNGVISCPSESNIDSYVKPYVKALKKLKKSLEKNGKRLVPMACSFGDKQSQKAYYAVLAKFLKAGFSIRGGKENNYKSNVSEVRDIVKLMQTHKQPIATISQTIEIMGTSPKT
ncbi:MAG: 3-keto-5-aminohexanoate cleavage protein [Alphaproteobacteria bacterium]|nr:3-keto-5-aminohexanoate cleavage protein [Alphaproteobacteria bacterium]